MRLERRRARCRPTRDASFQRPQLLSCRQKNGRMPVSTFGVLRSPARKRIGKAAHVHIRCVGTNAPNSTRVASAHVATADRLAHRAIHTRMWKPSMIRWQSQLPMLPRHLWQRCLVTCSSLAPEICLTHHPHHHRHHCTDGRRRRRHLLRFPSHLQLLLLLRRRRLRHLRRRHRHHHRRDRMPRHCMAAY